jgi:ribosomal protein S18 acetylase RimI-like enzyme
MDVVIRKALLTDIELILGFMKDYYKLEGKSFIRTKSQLTLQEFITNDSWGALFIIEYHGKPIGYFCLAFSYTLENYGRDCFLDEIFIESKYRNQGIGNQVMKQIETYLVAKDFKAIHLVVYNFNKNAFQYYLKNGFEKHDASFLTKIFIED